MAHPMHHVRQSRVEHSRVGHLTKGYKSGGAVKGEATIGKKALALHKQEHAALHAEGGKSKHRADRPHRAKGGKVKGKHNAKTIVNVIAGGHPAGGMAPPGPPMAPPGPPMGIAPAAAMPPPRPPMGPPPAVGPGGLPPPPPPMPMRARGGKVKHGPAWEEGREAGTQVQHTRGKGDLEQLGRGKQITYARGGSVKNITDPGKSDRLQMGDRFKSTPMEIRNQDSNTENDKSIGRARGGRANGGMADKVAPATKLPGGSGGGLARLAKEHRAERRG